jgi:endonuclease III
MTRTEKFEFLINYFSEHAPNPKTELNYSNPYQLLVAVILSAQCTDKRVNEVTPALFQQYPTPEHLAVSHFDELFPYIKKVSYPNSKAKHLLGMASMLVNDFKSKVPDNIEDLQKMPGVGRKTANVIASVIYGQPTMAVDTHVFRVSKRLGLVDETAKTPLEVEKGLVAYFSEEIIPKAHHWLILHGRYTCLARKPKCEVCGLTEVCDFYKRLVVD